MANDSSNLSSDPPAYPSANGAKAVVDSSSPPGHGSGHAHVPTHYAKRTPLNVTVFVVILAMALIVAFALVQHSHNATEALLSHGVEHSAAQPVAVDVVRVERAGVEKVLALPGDARSFYETTIFARTSGYLSKWFVDIGDRVTDGQVMAIIETPELDDQLNEARARVAGLNADAHVAETSANFARISFDRWEAAAPDGVVSAQERDQKKSEMDQSVAKLEAARAAVNLGEAELQRLETIEKFKKVTAPFDGVVTQRHIDIGALVTAGSTTNTTPLFTISQANQIRVFVDVPQAAAPDIRVGMHAEVTVRELPDHIFRGTVDRTATSIDPHSRTLKVEVLVPNPELTLLPGMYVQVSFQTNRPNPPLRIPPSALTFGPDGAQVAAVSPDGTVHFRPIKISRDLGNVVEVGSGLNEGDVVALNIGNQVTEGQRVEAHLVEETKSPSPVTPSGKVASAGEKSE